MQKLIRQLLAAIILVLMTGGSVAAVLQIRFPIAQIYFH